MRAALACGRSVERPHAFGVKTPQVMIPYHSTDSLPIHQYICTAPALSPLKKCPIQKSSPRTYLGYSGFSSPAHVYHPGIYSPRMATCIFPAQYFSNHNPETPEDAPHRPGIHPELFRNETDRFPLAVRMRVRQLHYVIVIHVFIPVAGNVRTNYLSYSIRTTFVKSRT